MKRYLFFVILAFIVFGALVLRVYKLGEIAPGISWDEAAVGYNAYTIAHWGRDEWGHFLPLTFKSFEDYKHPVHIYATVPFVGLFGLNEFTTRLPAALFGVGSVMVIFFLTWEIVGSRSAGLMAAFLLAISPYNLQFSRQNHELNFAVFFFMLGVLLFLRGIKKKPVNLIIAYLSFGICLITYHSSKIVAFPLVIFLTTLFIKDLIKKRKYFVFGLLAFLLFILLIIKDPNLLGLARANQTAFSQEQIQSTNWYQKTNNLLYGRVDLTAQQYLKHFGKIYLFEKGDQAARHSTHVMGEFYKVEAITLVAGVLFILYNILFKRKKLYIFLLAWGLLAPLPSAAVALSESPHAARAMFMTGSWHIVSALGAYVILKIVRLKFLQGSFLLVALALIFSQFVGYLKDYYFEYSKRDAIQWQYGMKQVVTYITEHPEYYYVYMTDIRAQPYIFFLYYLKTPLPEYLSSVKYNTSESRSFSLVESFDNNRFANWDPIESWPNLVTLQVMTVNHHFGLRYRDWFDVKEIVRFPAGDPAFYLVSAREDLDF